MILGKQRTIPVIFLGTLRTESLRENNFQVGAMLSITSEYQDQVTNLTILVVLIGVMDLVDFSVGIDHT